MTPKQLEVTEGGLAIASVAFPVFNVQSKGLTAEQLEVGETGLPPLVHHHDP
jgi:hypothetical protein